METEQDAQAAALPWRWPLLLALILLNITLPSLVLSYGTLLVYAVNNGVSIWCGIYTQTIFITTYCLSHCWCREAADSWGSTIGYRVLVTVGLLLIVTGLAICAFIPYSVQPYIYGGFGGLGSSLVSAQVDAVVFETYDTRLDVVRGLSFLGQAVGQSIFPHIISALVDYYGYSMFYLLLSAIVLQMLPAIMPLRIEENIKISSRYRDVAKTRFEMCNKGMKNNYYTNELQLHDLSKSWKNPNNRSDEDDFDTCDSDSVNVCTITPPPSPEERRRNSLGVEILPEIPEESEEEDSEMCDDHTRRNKKRLSVAIKRLSILGDNLDDVIVKQIRRDSKSDGISGYSELQVKYENISPVTDVNYETVTDTFQYRYHSISTNVKRKFHLPSYKVYRIRRRLLHTVHIFKDTFIKPLTRSLLCWRFYPVLLLCISRFLFMIVGLTLFPLMNLNMEEKVSMTETNFMISLFGFTWISFLVCTPWLTQYPKRNYKYVVVMGLFLTSAACYLLGEAQSHDAYSIACIVAGLGFGVITSTWETTTKEFVGAYNWPKVHSALENLSGVGTAAVVFGFSFVINLDDKSSLSFCLLLVSYFLISVTVIWFTISLISLYYVKMKPYRSKHVWST